MTTPDGVTIRAGTMQDRPAVRDLVRAAGLPLDGIEDAHAAVVAEERERIVGAALVERHEDGTGAAHLLRSVVVAPEARGRGIGDRLVRAALSRLEGPVALMTETAAAYFAARGFAPVARDDLPSALAASPELRGACPASATAMLLTRRAMSDGDPDRPY